MGTAAMVGKQCAGFGCTDPLPARPQLWLLARCVCATSSIALNFVSLQNLNLAMSTMIHCTSPLFVVVMGRVLLGERIRLLAYVCIAAAAAGMVVFVQPWRVEGEGGISLVGVAAAFGSSIMAAFSYT